MKSVEFLIDSQRQATKLIILTPKKVRGQHGPVSSLATKISSQTTYHLKV